MILKSLYYMIQHRSWGNDLFDGSNECRISGPLGRCQTVPNERSVIWRGHKEVCQVFASMILLYLLKHSMNSVYFWSTLCLTTPDEVMNFPGRICFFFKLSLSCLLTFLWFMKCFPVSERDGDCLVTYRSYTKTLSSLRDSYLDGCGLWLFYSTF